MRRGEEKGFLLIAVLVIVMLASMVALSLIFRLRAEQAGFAAGAGSEQAWSTVMSGVQHAMHLARAAGEDLSLWQNNPTAFYHQFVSDDGSDRWYFTIYSAGLNEVADLRYGLTDESSKLNLNKLNAAMLFRAFDWPSTLVHQVTGEQTEATNLVSGETSLPEITLRPQFNTVEELLLIPGFTPGMLYGEDANRNYALEPNEDDGDALFPPDDGDGQLFLGMQEFVTASSYEFDVTNERRPRIQLNSTNTTWTAKGLPEATVAFIKTAQAAGKQFQSSADLLLAKEKFKDASGKEVELESGVGPDELPLVLDQFTATFDATLIGLINVNTAPKEVLKALPGVDESKAETIVEAREAVRFEMRQTPAWLFQENLLTAEEFRKVAPLVTTRSQQFRFHVIGYAIPSGRYRVYEVVIDTADKQPQVLYSRDITRLGLPFALPVESEQTNVQKQS